MKFTISDIETRVQQFANQTPSIDKLLKFCTEEKCSDLYIKVNDYPYIFRYGKMIKVPCYPISDEIWNKWAGIAISSERNAGYVRQKMLDFQYTLPLHSFQSPEDIDKNGRNNEEYRYRVSAGFSEGNKIATFRMITPELPSFKNINYPQEVIDVIKQSMEQKSGIVMLVGETGSGKTTTLAASIHDFSQKGEPLDNSMIITLEDPIEYQYPSTSSTRIVQKELGIDFMSFPLGVKQSLREHPTHILCGEIRDEEGISTCVEAARTGHKVMTTFHTGSVSGTISRLYNYLSGDSDNIMFDLIANIDLIVCQRLTADGSEFKLDTQYMFFTDEIKRKLQKVIFEGKNIPMEVDELFNNPKLIEDKICKDWS